MPIKLKEDAEKLLISTVFDDELEVSKRNRDSVEADWDSYVSLLDNRRGEKEYDWMSDLHIPEFAAHVLTQCSLTANRDFSTRDFVECYLEEGSNEALKAADSAKELINRTLNQKHLHYFQKRIRASMISQLLGEFYAECWWEQEVQEVVIGKKPAFVDMQSGMEQEGEDIVVHIPTNDRFNFDVLDPRNVYTDSRYAYSLQEKDFVWYRREKTLDDLKGESKQAGYFNLDKIEEIWKKDTQTETNQETIGKDSDDQPTFSIARRWVDVYKRWGKFWVIVKQTDDETGLPTEIDFGLDSRGMPKKNAELHEVIMEFVKVPGASDPILIAFHPTPYVDAYGKPYRPIIRGKCYLHPTEDAGFGDAKYARDLQIAIDDTFNLAQDRATLAGFPMFQIQEESMTDNDSVYFEPGHFIKVKQQGDISEFKISDNTPGALNQMSMLMQQMQQISSTYPTTMGRLPATASTTATAIAGAEQRTDMRTNFKGMVQEQTFDLELYWQIMHMTWRFAKPVTGITLMGEKVYNFDPRREYWFKPVSQSVESEQSKAAKVKNLLNYLQILTPYAQFYANQPNFVEMLNHLFLKVSTYLGDEVSTISGKLLNPSQPPMPQGQDQAVGNMVPGGIQPSKQLQLPPTSNQYQQPMDPIQMVARMGGLSAF